MINYKYMKTSNLLFLIPFLLLTSCGPKEDNPEGGGNETGNTFTISFSDSSFTEQFSDGYNLTLSAGVVKLNTYVKSKISKDSILSEITTSNVHVHAYDDRNHLTLGSGNFANNKFNSGSLTWTSYESIYKVEVKAINYINVYSSGSYSGTNIDSPAHLKIGDSDYSLECGTTTIPDVKTFTKEFEEDVYTFSLTSENARVYIEELTITWRE